MSRYVNMACENVLNIYHESRKFMVFYENMFEKITPTHKKILSLYMAQIEECIRHNLMAFLYASSLYIVKTCQYGMWTCLNIYHESRKCMVFYENRFEKIAPTHWKILSLYMAHIEECIPHNLTAFLYVASMCSIFANKACRLAVCHLLLACSLVHEVDFHLADLLHVGGESRGWGAHG